jgi:hypothetical protein
MKNEVMFTLQFGGKLPRIFFKNPSYWNDEFYNLKPYLKNIDSYNFDIFVADYCEQKIDVDEWEQEKLFNDLCLYHDEENWIEGIILSEDDVYRYMLWYAHQTFIETIYKEIC